MSNGSADPNPTTDEWRVVDSYATGGAVPESWRAIGPWRSSQEDARLDAEHGSMRGALPPDSDDLTRLRADLDESKRRNACDACGGSGKPISGKPCMCRGTGLMSEAATYLREQLDAAVHRAERAEAEAAGHLVRLRDLAESFERDDGSLEHDFEIDNALERATEHLGKSIADAGAAMLAELDATKRERDIARGRAAWMHEAFWLAIVDLGHSDECDGEGNCTCWRAAADQLLTMRAEVDLCGRLRDAIDTAEIEKERRAEAEHRAERAEAACAAMREKSEMFVEEFERGEKELVAAWGSERVFDAYAYARGALKPAYDFARAALSSDAGAVLLAEAERLRELTGVMQERLERFENIEDAARLVCEWAVTVAVDGSTVKSAARNYLSGLANDAALTPAPAAEPPKEPTND